MGGSRTRGGVGDLNFRVGRWASRLEVESPERVGFKEGVELSVVVEEEADTDGEVGAEAEIGVAKEARGGRRMGRGRPEGGSLATAVGMRPSALAGLVSDTTQVFCILPSPN